MARPLRESVLGAGAAGFALIGGRGEVAERVLLELLARRGGSSETYAILGRVYKDRWQKAVADNGIALADGLLRTAVDTYLKGFESDWRDALPGINTVTLMELMIRRTRALMLCQSSDMHWAQDRGGRRITGLRPQGLSVWQARDEANDAWRSNRQRSREVEARSTAKTFAHGRHAWPASACLVSGHPATRSAGHE